MSYSIQYKTAAIVLGVLLVAPACWAAKEKKDSATGPDEDKSIVEMRKRVIEKQKELNGTKWSVAVGSTNPKVKPYTDDLIFQDGQVKMSALQKRGFGPTNYTVTSPEGSEATTWESMQTAKEGVIFLRGTWTKDVMEGAINEQFDGGKETRDSYFSSTGKLPIPPSSKKDKDGEETGEGVAAPSNEAPTTTEAPSKALKSLEKGKS